MWSLSQFFIFDSFLTKLSINCSTTLKIGADQFSQSSSKTGKLLYVFQQMKNTKPKSEEVYPKAQNKIVAEPRLHLRLPNVLLAILSSGLSLLQRHKYRILHRDRGLQEHSLLA